MKEKTRKLLKWIGISLLALIIAAVGILYGMFHHEISTIQSKEKLAEYPLYAMEYDGDYGFDDFLETGASSDGELVDFVVKKLLKGLPIEINIPSLGCSTFLAHNEEGEAIFGRNFDLSYSPAMMVKTKPENAYASISMVNLGFMGYGEGKLPDSFFSSVTSLAAPYAPLDGMNEKGLMVAAELIGQMRLGFDFKDASALDQIQKATLPILFIHGGADDYVPTYMGQELYDSYQGEKELLIVEGAGHGLSADVDPQGYYTKVFSFLQPYLK